MEDNIYKLTASGVDTVSEDWMAGASDERNAILELLDEVIEMDISDKEQFTNALGLFKLRVMAREDGEFF